MKLKIVTTISLIILGSITWLSTIVKSGAIYEYGLGFWGPHGHDGIWHISLINRLSQFSFELPMFDGATMKNYHFGFDLMTAVLHNLTGIPVMDLYFRLIPVLTSLSIGIFVFYLTYHWTKSIRIGNWAIFFTYFGGSLGWVVTLIRQGVFGGESLFWSQQAISTLVNPPLSMSLLLILVGLYLIQKRYFVVSGLVFSLLASVKIYAGLLVIAALLLAAIKNRPLWKTLLISAPISTILFLLVSSGSSNLITWSPLWFLTNLMNQDHLNWPRYFSALQTYSSGHIWHKAFPAYIVAGLIFILGNFAARTIGFLYFPGLKKISWWYLFCLTISLAGLIPPIFFLQTGTAWNTIQFVYYSLFFTGILSAMFIGRIKIKIFGLIVVIITLPSTLGTLPHYLPNRPPAKVSNSELLALEFLQKLPPGTVLTNPFDQNSAAIAQKNPPRPLYNYESTAYVSALSGKQVFLEDEVNLNILGINWQSRRKQVDNFFSNPEISFLNNNSISYVYLVSNLDFNLEDRLGGISLVFSNPEVKIYKVISQKSVK